MNLAGAEAAFLAALQGYRGYWCVAGGWALDFFLGRQTRPHEDLEVVALREEHELLYPHFRRFNARKIIVGEPPRFVLWEGGAIEENVIQLRLDPLPGGEEFDLLLTPSAGGDWICRRDENLRLPLESVRAFTPAGVPYLRPEIVLLFKAKHAREKDHLDFSHVLPDLSEEARGWLLAQLLRLYPGHGWLREFALGLGDNPR